MYDLVYTVVNTRYITLLRYLHHYSILEQTRVITTRIIIANIIIAIANRAARRVRCGTSTSKDSYHRGARWRKLSFRRTRCDFIAKHQRHRKARLPTAVQRLQQSRHRQHQQAWKVNVMLQMHIEGSKRIASSRMSCLRVSSCATCYQMH